MKYKKVTTEAPTGFSNPIFPKPVYRMACCDCGLVHTLKFSVVEVVKNNPNGSFEIAQQPAPKKYRVMFQAARNNRATAAMRREQKKREANGNA
jgi:hypothetical protein